MPISLLQAKTLALASVPVSPVKRVTLSEAVGRFLADGVTAKRAMPSQDLSAIDGYAVASVDLKGARRESPVRLKLIAAGLGDLHPGQAMRVAAGSAVPFGADSLVPLDGARPDADRLEVFVEPHPAQYLRRRGEQWKEHELVLSAGHRVDAATVAVLSAMGVGDVAVRPPTRVALLAAGAENTLATLAALVADLATEVVVREACGDREDAIAAPLERCLQRADVVIASPATVAQFAAVVKRLGGTVGFDAVAVKPGRQASVAVLKHKPIAILPGPGLATVAAFEALARPMLLKCHGVVEVKKKLTVRLAAPIKKRPGRVMLVPAKLEQTGGELFASFRLPVAGSLPGALACDGWLVLPEERGELERGDSVEMELRGMSAYAGLPTNPNDEATR